MRAKLNEQEQAEIADLNSYIAAGLACQVNSHIKLSQCGSCRLTNVRFMRRYLEIHGYYVVDQEVNNEN